MSMSIGPGAVLAGRRAARCLRMVVCAAPILVTVGCAAFPAMYADTQRPGSVDSGAESFSIPSPADAEVRQDRRFRRETIPGSQVLADERQPANEAQIAALVPDEVVDATLGPQTIPQFVATVFGSVLHLPYSMNSDVASRTEIIAGGTGGEISKRALFRLTQQALKQYGVEIYIENGALQIGPSGSVTDNADLYRGRDVSNGAGRVVQFFPVQTIEVGAIQGLLQDLFPSLSGARISPDSLTNSLVISGRGREVAQVVRALREIDQPRFAGASVLRIEPIYWPADTLSTSIEQALTTEGYIVSRQSVVGRAIVMLAFPNSNQILVISRDSNVLDRVQYWANMFDQPAGLGDKTSTFVYQVRNTDAQSVGQLAIGQTQTSPQPQLPAGVAGLSTGGGAAPVSVSGSFQGGRLLTDPIGNRVIFTGSASDYAKLRDLLNTLDVPAPQVVVEVMIAEVTLTDTTSIGVELFGTEARGDGVLTGTTEGLNIGAGAGVFTFVGPDYRARLVANAKNDRVNILQSPRLVTRSGVTARFQVGQDVPIITSQRALNSQTGGGDGTDVLQSVQYRQTGTILSITPVIYGDRVDIIIGQELSSTGGSLPGISSPIILNRSLTTQIAISDGWTGVLGGLISNNYSKVNTGIPFLKDLPVIGSVFQSNAVEGARTELLLLITPRIVRGDEDMADFVERYTADINAAFRTGRGWSYTLTPWSFGRGVRGVGIDLPSPEPASQRPPLFRRPAASDHDDAQPRDAASADAKSDEIATSTPATSD